MNTDGNVSIIISIKHEDNKNKPEVVHSLEPWVLPNHVFTETYHHGSSMKFFAENGEALKLEAILQKVGL